MKNLSWRVKYLSLALASGGMFVFQGCYLSDRQLATVWQSVLTTGLNTIVSTLISTAGETGAAAG